MFLRSCVKTELATPHPTDWKKTKKQSVSEMKVQVVTIDYLQKSPKSELSLGILKYFSAISKFNTKKRPKTQFLCTNWFENPVCMY